MSINEIATISPVVRDDGWKKNGTNVVRLRLTFKRQSRYIKTNIVLRKSQLGKNGQLRDTDLRMQTDSLVKKTEDRIGLLDPFVLQQMSMEDLVKYLQSAPEDPDEFRLDFFVFADTIINEKTGHSKNTYSTALNSFRRYIGKETMDIAELTSSLMRDWEKKLTEKHGVGARAISAYTACIAFLHGQARLRYNDEEIGIIRVRNPFQFYKPPRQKQARHRNVDEPLIQRMLDLRTSLSGRERLGVDVFLISFALMGMNSPDLFTCQAPKDDILHYYRTKTRTRRDDQAEMFVKIDPCVKQLLEEYMPGQSGRAFDFAERYTTYEIFGTNVNKGLKAFCERIGVPKVTLYSARHSWASIAYKAGIDKCTINDGLCHVDKDMKVTDIYINKDWSVLWRANGKVLDRFKWKKEDDL